ncbi:YopX family protein [Bacillus wiedmannii]|uniref:YopX protein domain-containing protein n=1 Tax=Bacillus wiedmannii TaxID=1890302 RepID=A0A2B5I3W9_9BACI|nr:YopX family protein [Bacillus wiedmannii]PFZ19510.1 hypothetical protein COL66_29110 [Bacillus wiedmannii]
MRVIKFDAIYKPTGEHFAPIYINFENKTTHGNFDGQVNDWCHFSLDGKYGDAILRQYTGLKDAHGKEIYEGDIVDTVYDGTLFTGVVVYDESELDFKATNGKENYGSNFQYLPCCEEVEVIGNIYENPELLNEVGDVE